MPLKCCAPVCEANYDTQKKYTSIYKLPKNEEERNSWVRMIPRANLKITKYTAVCRDHWPEDVEFKAAINGKLRPAVPPTIFDKVPDSCVPTPPAKCRKTIEHTSSEARNVEHDELSNFEQIDAIKLENIPDYFNENQQITAFIVNDGVRIQSTDLRSGVPKFVINLKNDFSFACFYCGISCIISTLSHNNFSLCTSWSTLEEIIRFLENKELQHKENILHGHISSMGTKQVGKPIYSPETITRAFEYFAVSRSLYSRLIDDYHLPSARTLTRITSQVDKQTNIEYLKNILKKLPFSQRRCILLMDEVYIKSALTYHGGTVFGKAIDQPDKLAKTVCAMMVRCLYGGPDFLAKMLPVSNLTAQFLFDQSSPLIDAINAVVNGKVLAIIADGHRINQKYFETMNTVQDKPWLSDDNTFLLYDFVHVMKCVRNNWLTEKCGELKFEFDDEVHIARWNDLIELYKVESKDLVKLSKLTRKAVYPKPIERQSVSTCLQVFSDETVSALETHPLIDHLRFHSYCWVSSNETWNLWY